MTDTTHNVIPIRPLIHLIQLNQLSYLTLHLGLDLDYCYWRSFSNATTKVIKVSQHHLTEETLILFQTQTELNLDDEMRQYTSEMTMINQTFWYPHRNVCWAKVCPNRSRRRSAIIIFRQHLNALYLKQLDQVVQAVGPFDLDLHREIQGDGLVIDDH